MSSTRGSQREIRTLMAAERYTEAPAQIRSTKRLWSARGTPEAPRPRSGHVRAWTQRIHSSVMITPALALGLVASAPSAQIVCEQGTSQAALAACAEVELARSDVELNDVYARTIRSLSRDDVAELRAARRAWIRFRDLDCETVGSASEGGSVAPYELARCLTEHTTARTATLRARYQGSAPRGGGPDSQPKG